MISPDRPRAFRITGNIAPGHSQSEVLAYAKELATHVPVGYSVVFSGQSSQFGDAMTSLLFALVIGILVAYMVLASQFNSLLHPVTVLTILPLSLAGAMVARYVTGKTINIFSMIGLLLLMVADRAKTFRSRRRAAKAAALGLPPVPELEPPH